MFALLGDGSFARPTPAGPPQRSSPIGAAITADRRDPSAPAALFRPAGGDGSCAPEHRSVLVAHADPDQREAIARYLCTAGACRLTEVGSAADALAHVRSERARGYAVVHLPLPGGDDLLRELRSRGWRTAVLGHAAPAAVPASAAPAPTARVVLRPLTRRPALLAS